MLDAAKWIKDGKVYKIGRIYEAGMPLFGARVFALRIPGSPTGGPFGYNKLVYHDEFLATEIGQIGTQFDGLGHIGIQLGKDGDKSEMHFYNGFTAAEISDAYGLKKLGVEKLKPLFTRGAPVRHVGAEGPHDGRRRGDHRRGHRAPRCRSRTCRKATSSRATRSSSTPAGARCG